MGASKSNAHLVYVIVGRDRFLRRDMLERILAELAGEVDELGPTRIDGAEAVAADVLDEVRTPSLLGARRVVVVDNADGFISDHRALLERYCSNPTASGCLVLLCNALPKNTRLYRIVSAHGTVIPCEAPKGRGLLSWIDARARQVHGKRLLAPGAQRLREQLGDALGRIDAELAKLSAFVGRRDEITPADIDTLTGHHREEKVFAVTDAATVANVAKST